MALVRTPDRECSVFSKIHATFESRTYFSGGRGGGVPIDMGPTEFIVLAGQEKRIWVRCSGLGVIAYH